MHINKFNICTSLTLNKWGQINFFIQTLIARIISNKWVSLCLSFFFLMLMNEKRQNLLHFLMTDLICFSNSWRQNFQF